MSRSPLPGRLMTAILLVASTGTTVVSAADAVNQPPTIVWAAPSTPLTTDDGMGVSFLYRQGRCYSVADIPSLPLTWSGVNTQGFNLDLRMQNEYFAVQFQGTLRIPVAGTYTFWTRSDDGSQLRIGSTVVVNNDRDHGMTEKTGTITLEAGDVPIAVDYYNGSGSYGLEVSWSGPDFAREAIPASRLRRALTPMPEAVVAAVPGWKRLLAPATITLPAAVADVDGMVVRVEATINGTPLTPVVQAPFEITVTGLAAGVYEVVARAIDDAGAPSMPVTMALEVLATATSDGPTVTKLYAGIPGCSRVSPVGVEGREVATRGAQVWGPTGSVATRRLAPGRFLAEVPLTPGVPSMIRVSDGQREVQQTVEWQPTPIDSSLPAVGIRRGDSLLLQGPAGGVLLRSQGYDDPIVIATFPAAGLLAVDFPDPGVIELMARRPDGSIAGTQTVVVYGCDPQGPTACHVNYERKKPVSVLGGSAVGVWVGSSWPSAMSVRRTAFGDGNLMLALKPTKLGASYVLRLGNQDGPVLFAGPVDAFSATYSASTKFAIVGTYPDGTRIGEGTITMTPLVPAVDVQLSLWGSGTSFMDGATTNWLSTTAFDRSGSVGLGHYQIVIAATRTGHVCHAIRFYQSGIQISN